MMGLSKKVSVEVYRHRPARTVRSVSKLSGIERQRQRAFQTPAQRVAQDQRAAVLARNITGDGQPKPGSAGLARARRLEAIERVEDLFHLRSRYAGASVAHANHGLVSLARRRHARTS